MKKLTSSIITAAVLASAAGLAQAQAYDTPTPLNYSQSVSREQVRNELNAALRSGALAPGHTEYGLVGPGASTTPTGPVESRTEVASELQAARAQGQLAATYTERGLVGPGVTTTVAGAKTRSEVRAEIAVARAQGLLDSGRAEIGIVGPQRARAIRTESTGVAARGVSSGS